MTPPVLYPKLRWPLDVRFEEFEDQQVLIISCPLGLTRSPLALIPAVAPVLSCFEGNMSLEQILQRFTPQGLSIQTLHELVRLLDDNLFLATPRFFSAQAAMHEEYKNSPARQPFLAGSSYAQNPQELEKEIDSYLAVKDHIYTAHNGTLCALKAPHIDYRRGSPSYGITYNYLRDSSHDLYVLIGTAHQYSRHMFHLTAKDFLTPLGNLPAKRNFIEKLSLRYGKERSFADEILHKKEHSLELQTPFLSRLKQNAAIVPVLVGGFHHLLSGGRYPEQDPVYDDFVSALAECIKESGKEGQRICFIAGVDMAHVGRYFGDKDSLTPEKMKDIAARDHTYLQHIQKQDKKSLFDHIAEDGDDRKICGFPTMYTIIDVFDRLGIKYNARLYDYRQAVNYRNDCAVTFAGMGFYTGAA